ncbi:hypothetical protein QJS04_geneDACA023317 [Acorus gramineus]|uniref:DSBA-like thioredoxin domain-containing protein n=1 Tax=Acorus gramineus TaxID=55184 RepID=A0AAV9BF00_ACOGR|nr:hypothetical protein QJS04_geneDACA021463 [Acorus gramineus]KAK1274598.1 hypothetical protein QJS04_geneDACA023317 [Acorus gramineus]
MADPSMKRLIRLDVVSDTVCPWCFVGKRNLNKAMALSSNEFDFEVRWHPYMLNPSAPREGVKKSEFYRQKFGAHQFERMMSRMSEVFRGLGLEYDTSGLTGNTLDSHRLITFSGHQGLEKQNALVEELFVNYFTQGKYIGDRQVLLEAANKAAVEGAAEFLEDPKNGLDEVNEELTKHATHVNGVPHFVINGKHQLNGAQAPEVFMRAFQAASK